MPNVDTPPEKRMNVGVLVLGDVGRSPRMQYHALSFVEISEVNLVFLVGYEGEDCFSSLNEKSNIIVIRIPTLSNCMNKVQKAIRLFCSVWKTLSSLDKIELLIVQNPPSIPTLLVCSLWCGIHNCTLIYDWHNLGFTMFPSTGIRNRVLSAITYGVEFIFGQLSDINFCVSSKMKDWLKSHFFISSHVLYDFPPAHFQPLPPASRNSIRTSFLHNVLGITTPISLIIMSSSSYTDDEDIDTLFNILPELNDGLNDHILILLTGKGPNRKYYESKQNCYSKITISFQYLSASDYIIALQVSDIGLCFHSTTSSLDLPMKVRDMFGCGLYCLLLSTSNNKDVYCEMAGIWDEDEYGFFTSEKGLLDLLLNGDLNDNNRNKTNSKNKKKTKIGWSEEWSRVCLKEVIKTRGHFMSKSRFVVFILIILIVSILLVVVVK